jgi:hypothetical protein
MLVGAAAASARVVLGSAIRCADKTHAHSAAPDLD